MPYDYIIWPRSPGIGSPIPPPIAGFVQETAPILSQCSLCQAIAHPSQERLIWDRELDGGRAIHLAFVGGILIAFTHEHTPNFLVKSWEFKRQIIEKLRELGFSDQILPYVEFDANGKGSTASWDSALVPPNFGFPTLQVQQHPALAVNVFRLQRHSQLPVRVADQLVLAAQRYVGYFYGEYVRATQMHPNTRIEDGVVTDPSVHLTGEEWVEPFEPGDECKFCQRMTDQSIEDRVEAFQWELDKESHHHPPQFAEPGWRQAHAQEIARNVETVRASGRSDTGIWAPFDLTALPTRLKRSLCIEWNHIWRGWEREDLRYVEKDREWFMLYTERLDGPDQRPSLRVRMSPWWFGGIGGI